MNFLAEFFGRFKSDEQPLTPGEAIQKLRDVEEMLKKKQEYLEKNIDEELSIAKKNGTKNKMIALNALKKKKRYERQLTQIDGTLTTIESQRESLENINTNTEVMKVMKDAAKVLKIAHKDIDIDDVHDLMDEIQEEQQIANEISDALSNPICLGNDMDEGELLKELEELEQEEPDKHILDIGSLTENLPSPPMEEPNLPSKARVEEGKDDMEEFPTLAS